MQALRIALSLAVSLAGLATAEAQTDSKGGSQTEEVPANTVLAEPSPRQGPFIAVGTHVTSAMVARGSGERRGPGLGGGLSLRVGERIHPWFDVGLALAFSSVRGDEPWMFGRLTVHGQVYVENKTFIAAGFGFGAAGANSSNDDVSSGSYGDVYTAGVGRNFYLSNADRSGGWIATPVVTAEYSRDAEFGNRAIWIGIEMSHWWGVRRNRLKLNIEDAYQ